MTTTSPAKKDIQKLQRAIVDGLEKVKALDIVVFDTEHLSSLFERVIIASGSSNRQTKALGSSVRDALRDAGFARPRMEGESNGEWIIVDCAQAVVHIMQPNFRQYYNLEELWGDKPVRLKYGASKPAVKNLVKPISGKEGSVKPQGSLRRSNAAKKGVQQAFPSKAQERKLRVPKAPTPPAVKKTAATKVALPKPAVKKPVVKKTATRKT
jgi:ribosome-associated protein